MSLGRRSAYVIISVVSCSAAVGYVNIFWDPYVEFDSLVRILSGPKVCLILAVLLWPVTMMCARPTRLRKWQIV